MDRINHLDVAQIRDNIATLIADALASDLKGTAAGLASASSAASRLQLTSTAALLSAYAEHPKLVFADAAADADFFIRAMNDEFATSAECGLLLSVCSCDMNETTGNHHMQMILNRACGPIPAGTGVFVTMSQETKFVAHFNRLDDHTHEKMFCDEYRDAALSRLIEIDIMSGEVMDGGLKRMRKTMTAQAIINRICEAVERSIISSFDLDDIDFYFENQTAIDDLASSAAPLMISDVLSAALLYVELRPDADDRAWTPEDGEAIILLADAIVRGSQS